MSARARLSLALLLPTLLVLVGLHGLADIRATFLLYVLGGCVLGPWLVVGARPFAAGGGLPFRAPGATRRGLWLALLFGPVFLGVYWLLFPWLADATFYLDALEARGFERERLALYALLFLVLIPWVEEWWWRGQALPRAQREFGRTPGLLLAAAGFGLYHYFVLATLYPWPLALLRGTGILAAGVVWCVLAARARSWQPTWWAHLAADIAVVCAFRWLVLPGAAG